MLSEAEASAVSATPRAVSVGTQAYNVPASHADAAKDIEGGAAGAGAGAGSGAGSGEAPRPATKKGDAVGAPIMHAAGLLQVKSLWVVVAVHVYVLCHILNATLSSTPRCADDWASHVH